MTIGALLGFLSLNWNPSEIYMGDTGSQFIGVFLAAIGIVFLWQFRPAESTQIIHFKQLLLPFLAFLIPFVDTISVMSWRIFRGVSPFQGGIDHTTHQLAYQGLSDRQVAITFASISLIGIALVGISIEVYDSWKAIYTVGIFAYLFLAFGFTQYLFFVNHKDQKMDLKTKSGKVKSIENQRKAQ